MLSIVNKTSTSLAGYVNVTSSTVPKTKANYPQSQLTYSQVRCVAFYIIQGWCLGGRDGELADCLGRMQADAERTIDFSLSSENLKWDP